MKSTADHDPLVPELWSLIPPLFVRFCKGLFSDFLSTDSLELTFKKRSLKHIEWPYWEMSITHYLGVWSLIPHLCNIVPVTWKLCATPYRTSKTHRMDAATLLIVTDEDRDPQNNNAYLKVRRLNEVAGLWCFHLQVTKVSHIVKYTMHPHPVLNSRVSLQSQLCFKSSRLFLKVKTNLLLWFQNFQWQ